MKVFMSSRFEEFEDLRKDLGTRFEDFPAIALVGLSQEQAEPGIGALEASLRAVDDAHLMVLLLGATYGEPVVDGLSITHLEFQRAVARGIPVLAFASPDVMAGDAQERAVAFLSAVIGDDERRVAQLKGSPMERSGAVAGQVSRYVGFLDGDFADDGDFPSIVERDLRALGLKGLDTFLLPAELVQGGRLAALVERRRLALGMLQEQVGFAEPQMMLLQTRSVDHVPLDWSTNYLIGRIAEIDAGGVELRSPVYSSLVRDLSRGLGVRELSWAPRPAGGETDDLVRRRTEAGLVLAGRLAQRTGQAPVMRDAYEALERFATENPKKLGAQTRTQLVICGLQAGEVANAAAAYLDLVQAFPTAAALLRRSPELDDNERVNELDEVAIDFLRQRAAYVEGVYHLEKGSIASSWRDTDDAIRSMRGFAGKCRRGVLDAVALIDRIEDQKERDEAQTALDQDAHDRRVAEIEAQTRQGFAADCATRVEQLTGQPRPTSQGAIEYLADAERAALSACGAAEAELASRRKEARLVKAAGDHWWLNALAVALVVVVLVMAVREFSGGPLRLLVVIGLGWGVAKIVLAVYDSVCARRVTNQEAEVAGCEDTRDQVQNLQTQAQTHSPQVDIGPRPTLPERPTSDALEAEARLIRAEMRRFNRAFGMFPNLYFARYRRLVPNLPAGTLTRWKAEENADFSGGLLMGSQDQCIVVVRGSHAVSDLAVFAGEKLEEEWLDYLEQWLEHELSQEVAAATGG